MKIRNMTVPPLEYEKDQDRPRSKQKMSFIVFDEGQDNADQHADRMSQTDKSFLHEKHLHRTRIYILPLKSLKDYHEVDQKKQLSAKIGRLGGEES